MVTVASGNAAPAPPDPPPALGAASSALVVPDTETKVFHDQVVPLTEEEAVAQAAAQKKHEQKKKQDEKAPKYAWDPGVLACVVWELGGGFIMMSRDELFRLDEFPGATVYRELRENEMKNKEEMIAQGAEIIEAPDTDGVQQSYLKEIVKPLRRSDPDHLKKFLFVS